MRYCPVCETDKQDTPCPDCGNSTESRPRDYGRSVGQLIGKLQEKAIQAIFEDSGLDFEHSVRLDMPVSVEGEPLTQETDFVISYDEMPVVGVESKSLRSKKHAREKVYQMVCMAQMRDESYPEVTNFAILTGNFTDASLQVAEWGLDEVYHIPFDELAERLSELGIVIEWGSDEHTEETLRTTWERCHTLMKTDNDALLDAFFSDTDLHCDVLDATRSQVSHRA